MTIPNYKFNAEPHWENECGHKDYLFSVAYDDENFGSSQRKLDVYLVARGKSSDICIRYGPEGDDYLSPPPLSDIFRWILHGVADENKTYLVVADALCLNYKLNVELKAVTK
jgi:hypothetical protein